MAAIYLVPLSPTESTAIYPRNKGRGTRPLLDLAPDEVCHAFAVANEPVSSYLAISPLPANSPEGQPTGGIFSAALSVALCARELPGIIPCGARTFLWFDPAAARPVLKMLFGAMDSRAPKTIFPKYRSHDSVPVYRKCRLSRQTRAQRRNSPDPLNRRHLHHQTHTLRQRVRRLPPRRVYGCSMGKTEFLLHRVHR